MINFTTDLWCIDCNKNNDLVGKAVIIHNGQDDYVSQPSGAVSYTHLTLPTILLV